MLKISSHIERLLLFNDCVIIPDFGGFVLQVHSAIYDSEEFTFRPPYKDIVFNPTLKHNDGLLSELYMQLYGMDFNEAQSAMKADIDALKRALDSDEIICLGSIGKFRKENRATLLYEPGNDTSMFNVSSYGLPTFYLPPIQVNLEMPVAIRRHSGEDRIHSAEETKQITFLPVNKMLSRVAGVAAAAIVVFLLISTPVKDVNKSAYTASFIPSEMAPKQFTAKNELIANEEDNDMETDVAAMEVPALIQAENQRTPLDVESHVTITNAQPVLMVESVTPQTYYVVIASLRSEKELNKFLSKAVSTELKNMGVVKSSERIRVYADKSNDRKGAEEYMLFLRKNEKYKDAWLFIGR